MENASKALIIAGAILLSIAIIGIGMAVFNMAQSSIADSDISAEQASAYNAKFLSYEGIQTGTTVKALLDAVRAHNATNSADTTRQISVANSVAKDSTSATADAAKGTIAAAVAKEKIVSGKQYTVSIGYSTTGLVKNIGIVEKK